MRVRFTDGDRHHEKRKKAGCIRRCERPEPVLHQLESHKATINNTYKDKYVWITTMELNGSGGKGNQINSGCIDPGQQRTWTEDRYQIGNHWVRAEVMAGKECKGAKVCDTTANNYSQDGMHKNKPVFVRQNAKDANNCFIDWK